MSLWGKISPQYHLYKKLLTENNYLWYKVWITEPVLKAAFFFPCAIFVEETKNIFYMYTGCQLPLTGLTI